MESVFTPVYLRFISDSCATLIHLTDETINKPYLISRMTLKAIPRVQKVKVNAGCVLHGYLETYFTLEIVTVMHNELIICLWRILILNFRLTKDAH